VWLNSGEEALEFVPPDKYDLRVVPEGTRNIVAPLLWLCFAA
jgi:hypothetical protein